MLRWPPFLALTLLLALVFGLLVTANSAGYRFGISDQAFYIPAIDLWRWPDLFPRDRVLFEPQARRTVIDEALVDLPRHRPFARASVPPRLRLHDRDIHGRRRARWPIAVSIALGDRLPDGGAVAAPPDSETAANTFEGYFHPRVLAFAIGLVGVGLLLHRQRALALAVSALAVAVHPTTGGWFLVWLVCRVGHAPARTRWIAGIAGAAMLLLTALAARDELAAGLTIMDPAWTAAFSNRDYVFPLSSWSVGTWLALLVSPAIVVAAALWRQRIGECSPSERAIAVGALSLFGVFLLSLPFMAARVALAIQLQTSRVFWPIEFLATAYMVWVVAEAPWTVKPVAARARILVAVLLVAAAARGFYVLRIEHDNPLVAVGCSERNGSASVDGLPRRRRVTRTFSSTRARLPVRQQLSRRGAARRAAGGRERPRHGALFPRCRHPTGGTAPGGKRPRCPRRIAHHAAGAQVRPRLPGDRAELDFRLVHREGALRLYRLE